MSRSIASALAAALERRADELQPWAEPPRAVGASLAASLAAALEARAAELGGARVPRRLSIEDERRELAITHALISRARAARIAPR